MHLDPGAIRRIALKRGRVRKQAVDEYLAGGTIFDSQREFLPAGIAADEDPAGKGVRKLVGVDVRMASRRRQRFLHVTVPHNILTFQEALLRVAEHGRDFHDVQCGPEPAEESELFQHAGSELSGAGTGFDDMAGRTGPKPAGDRRSKRGAEPGPCRKIASATDCANLLCIVAELRMVERGFHELFKRDAPAALQFLEEFPNHGFVSNSSF